MRATKPIVYIAGPYAHPDPVENTNIAIKFASRLADDDKVTPLVPHLTMLWHLVDPHPVEFWYAYDIEVMLRCDAVLRIAGESTGADNEEKVAVENDIPIFYTLDDLYNWVDNAQ